MKKFYFVISFFISICFAFGQDVLNDYRSIGTGNWETITSWETYNGTSWIAASNYPGQITTTTNNIEVRLGHTITVTTNLVTDPMGTVTVNGTLVLDPPNNPREISLRTDLLEIGSSGILNFSGSQASLILPSGAALVFQNGGDIAGSCTPNNQIEIGGIVYAACRSNTTTVFTFGDVVAAGSTLNAQIITPNTLSVNEEICSTLTVEGSYTGPTNSGDIINYSWLVADPNGNIVATSLDSGTLNAVGQIASTNFTVTELGDYILSFEVSDGSFTNVETRTIIVTPDTQNPTASNPADINVQCLSDVPAVNTAVVTD
ncbi:hypothetical protein, partial [Winogradskyella immobilis]